MPAPRVYADATPLIALARIGRLELLREAGPIVYVTAGVWSEVAGDPGKPGVADILEAERAGSIVVVSEGNASDFPQLGVGEAETLSAARSFRSTPALVLIDEDKARRLLQTDPSLAMVARLSTIGLVVRAKRRGAIPSAQAVLDALRGANFYQTQTVYEEALRAVNEWPPLASPTETPDSP